MAEPADLERRTTALLQRLIRFRTVNPPGNEEPLQEYLRGILEEAGFECELLARVPGRPNLIARLRGRSDGPRLAYLGHVDTVLAQPDEWSVDPWGGELRDGCVWGRGALDMKDQVAAEVAAVVALAEEGWRPGSGELLLVLTADEEAGGEGGAKWLCEERPDAVRCDLVVNEGAGNPYDFDGRRVYEVCVAEKGVFRFTLTTRGRAGHASIPRIGDNALVKLVPFVEALSDGRPSPDPAPELVVELTALGFDGSEPQAALAELEQREPRLAVQLEPLLGVTFTPTMARASDKVNVIPSRAELKVDCRVPPELGEAHVRRRLAERIGTDGYELRFDEAVTGNRSPADTPLMDVITRFVERQLPGSAVVPTVLAGFTDSRWFRAAFPDCVAYGFCPATAFDAFEAAPLVHGADERVPVEDLGLAARFFYELAQEVLA